jgi:hypothetical protein
MRANLNAAPSRALHVQRYYSENKVHGDKQVALFREMAILGKTIEEAAEAAGIKVNSVRSLLYKKLGSAVWPPKP